jgi:hypothetical protein
MFKRVIYKGTAKSFRGGSFVFTSNKNFNDMTPEQADSFRGSPDFVIVDSPKAQNSILETKTINTSSEDVKDAQSEAEEPTNGIDEEESNEEESNDDKKDKKVKKVKVKK